MKQLIETETFELLLSDNSKTATDNLIKENYKVGGNRSKPCFIVSYSPLHSIPFRKYD